MKFLNFINQNGSNRKKRSANFLLSGLEIHWLPYELIYNLEVYNLEIILKYYLKCYIFELPFLLAGGFIDFRFVCRIFCSKFLCRKPPEDNCFGLFFISKICDMTNSRALLPIDNWGQFSNFKII